MKSALHLLLAALLAASSTFAAEEEKKAETAPEPKPDPTESLFKGAEKPVDIGGFGSDQPIERADMPTRGVLKFAKGTFTRTAQQHWEQFDWKPFTMKRWGRYHVRLTYTLKFAFLPSLFKIGTQSLKHPLTAAQAPNSMYLGTIYIDKPGEYGCSFYAPSSAAESSLDVIELALIPAPEGPPPTQAGDGKIILPASSATTWSETMRYEPKPEKNCLGYWTSPDDHAEWEFEVTQPGKYALSIIHGCGDGNHGSEILVKVAGKDLQFTTQDTGGFQKWKELPIGEIELPAGTTRLLVDPLTKAKSAVLDIQRLELKPVK
ncbi:MAG: hypothetical protein IPK32_21085 [Verrucomicrobiaceae bacterium]|nr:hypothetical protein [Verrucomicrobiaceae bacterium]